MRIRKNHPQTIETQARELRRLRGEDDEDVEPIWGEEDGAYFCGICGWEIAEGVCQNCRQGYDVRRYARSLWSLWWSDVSAQAYDLDVDPEGNLLEYSDDVFAENDEDYRLTAARGTTPLLEVDPARLRLDTVAYGYTGRMNEYRDLLARGATRLMCEAFYLSFSQETGIVLEMREDLFHEWAGAELRNAESWTVYLGREIRLDDEDEDGSLYIDAVLEEALLFGGYTESLVFWETVQTEPRHWVTRPTSDFNGEAPPSPALSALSSSYAVGERLDIDNQVRPAQLARDDYLSDNSADDDDELDSADDEDGQAQLGWDGEGGWGPDGPRESDNENAMDEEHTAVADNDGDEEDDESVDEDVTMASEADSFDSDFDSSEELSGDEDVVTGNVRYFGSI